MKWIIEVMGERNLLEELVKSFASTEFSFIQEGDKYFLKSTDFKGKETAEAVYNEANEIIPLLSGAIRIVFGHPLRMGNVYRVDDDGTMQEFGFAWADNELPAFYGNATTNGASISCCRADNVKIQIAIALRNVKVAEAFALFGVEDLNWVICYKIFEIISDDLGGEKAFLKSFNISKDELNRFTQTAQPHRHAKNSNAHSKWNGHEKPMSFSEAKSFVKRILTDWLQNKREYYSGIKS